MAPKKLKKQLKKQNLTRTQKHSCGKICLLGQGEGKKHLGETTFMKWNPLTPISIFLMVKIIVNNHFFLSIMESESSLSSHKKIEKWGKRTLISKLNFWQLKKSITYKLKKLMDQNKVFVWSLESSPIILIIFTLVMWLSIKLFFQKNYVLILV